VRIDLQRRFVQAHWLGVRERRTSSAPSGFKPLEVCERRELRVLERLQQSLGIQHVEAALTQALYALLLRAEPLRTFGQAPTRPSYGAGVLEGQDDGGHEIMASWMARPIVASLAPGVPEVIRGAGFD
jgi:hypothetical protein